MSLPKLDSPVFHILIGDEGVLIMIGTTMVEKIGGPDAVQKARVQCARLNTAVARAFDER